MPSRLRYALIFDRMEDVYFYRGRNVIEELTNLISRFGEIELQRSLGGVLELVELGILSKNKATVEIFGIASGLSEVMMPYRLLITRERRGTYHAKEAIIHMSRQVCPGYTRKKMPHVFQRATNAHRSRYPTSTRVARQPNSLQIREMNEQSPTDEASRSWVDFGITR